MRAEQRMAILDARTARMGGGINFVAELGPRLEREISRRGWDLQILAGPASGWRERLQRRSLLTVAQAILHAGNRTTVSPGARKVVCVRDRLLVQPCQGAPQRSPRFLLRLALTAHALRVSSAVVVPSHSMVEPVERLLARLGLRHPPTVHVIPHGRPSWASPPVRPLGEPLRLLYPSHVGRHKNFALLARVLRLIRSHSRLAVKLTLTATGRELVNGKTLESLFDPVVGDVLFTGPVSRAELPGLYEGHDVLVFPSLAESFGLPLLEAMVMRMAIVASDRDWAREVCGESALYAQPHDEQAWVTALEACQKQGLRDNLTGAVRAERFDWGRAAAAYALLLVANE